jgi:glycosyltransferase involved in cell wall biosynthesis
VLDLQWLGPFGSKNRAFTDVLSSAELASGPTIPLKLSRKQLSTPPKTVTVVNDGSQEQRPSWLDEYPGSIINFTKNRGPAYARNAGFGFQEGTPFEKILPVLAYPTLESPSYLKRGYDPRLKYSNYVPNPKRFEWDSDVDWFYFTDCGCRHTKDLFRVFEQTWQTEGDSTVAISGPVHGEGDGIINRYMAKQGILYPPMEDYLYGKKIPQSVITANVLVNGLAFSYLGGFDIDFTEAAGEDLDLGLRLRRLGMIGWSSDALVTHRFDEDRSDFIKRFRRYGRGNRLLEIKHNLPSLRASKFKASDPEFKEPGI